RWSHPGWLLIANSSARDVQQREPLGQRGSVDQLASRGVGGYRRAVQGATCGRGQTLCHSLVQHLPVKFVETGPNAVAEGVPTGACRSTAAEQPADGL